MRSKIQTRLIPGSGTPAGDMSTVHLPGLQFRNSGSDGGGSTHVYADSYPGTMITAGGTAGAGSSTTDFDYRRGGKGQLQRSAFGSDPLAAYDTGTVSNIGSDAATNTLSKADGWGTLTAGQIVLVEGLAAPSPLFIAPVLSVAGNDITLDPNFAALGNEVAGNPVRVFHDENLRLGNQDKPFLLEGWNPHTSADRTPYGWVAHDCLCLNWGIRMTYGNDKPVPVTQNFTIQPMGRTTNIASQLANGTLTEIDVPLFDSGLGFGDRLNSTVGMGLRHNGLLIPGVFVQNLELSVQSPSLNKGGCGADGSTFLTRDGEIDGRLTLTVDKGTAGWRTLRDEMDSSTQATRTSFGFGWQKGGYRVYVYLPSLQPLRDSTDSGATKTGDDEDAFTYKVVREPSYLFSPIVLAHFAPV